MSYWVALITMIRTYLFDRVCYIFQGFVLYWCIIGLQAIPDINVTSRTAGCIEQAICDLFFFYYNLKAYTNRQSHRDNL